MTRARTGPVTGFLASVSVLALLAVACGVTTPSGTPSGASPGIPGSARPGATPWLGNTVLGLEGLALADGEIGQAVSDFNAGVQASDPALMLEAADGLAGVDVLLANIDRIEPYPPMKPFADEYRAAITEMSAAAKELGTAIRAGDGAGTTAASTKLVASFTKYANIQSQLAAWVVQIPEQKKILVR